MILSTKLKVDLNHKLASLVKYLSSNIKNKDIVTPLTFLNRPYHDNDFIYEFKKIKLVPTADELNSKYELKNNYNRFNNFLISESNNNNDDRVKESIIKDSNQRNLIDRLFRSYRDETILDPLKKDIKERIGTSLTNSIRKEFFFSNALICSFDFLEPRPYIIIQLELPRGLQKKLKTMSIEERKVFFENGDGKNILVEDSILIIFDRKNNIEFSAVIAKRDIDQLTAYEGCGLFIGISLDKDQIKNFVFKMGKSFFNEKYYAYSSTISMVPHKHVMSYLKSTDAIPLAETLFFKKSPRQISNNSLITNAVTGFELFDSSQLQAIQTSITNDVTLIQGEPRSGKSLVGNQIIKYLISNQTSNDPVRVLFICNSSSELDKDLESLLELGIPSESICRLGSSTDITSENLRDLNLRDSDKKPNLKKKLDDKLTNLSSQLKDVRSEIEKTEHLLELWTDNENDNYDNMLNFLNEKYPNSFQFKGTDFLTYSLIELWNELWITKPKYFPLQRKDDNSIIHLTFEQRQELITNWQQEWLSLKHSEDIEKLQSAIAEYEKISNEINAAKNDVYLKRLQGSSIIAGTIEKAIQYSEVLKQVGNTVVVVTDATSISEAILLSCLPDSLKKLILIGDYNKGVLVNNRIEDFEPKINSVSLFDRLIFKDNFPVQVLDCSFIEKRIKKLNNIDSLTIKDQFIGTLKDIEKENWQKVYEKTLYCESIIEGEISDIDLLSPITLSTFCLHLLAKVNLAEDIDITRSYISAMLDHINKTNSPIDPKYNDLQGIIYYILATFHSQPLHYNISSATENAKKFINLFNSNSLMDISLFNSWSLTMSSIIEREKSLSITTDIKAINNIKVPTAAEDWKTIRSVFVTDRNNRYKRLPLNSLDKLIALIGLEKVKRSFLEEFYKISVSKEQSLRTETSNYNAYFIGNPGTGKSSVADIYAQFLIELRILPSSSKVHKVSGSSLLLGGIKDLEGILQLVKSDDGGVIVVDEAYQLSPETDRDGRKVTDYILSHSDKFISKYGPLVWIFAGYKKEIESLLQYNLGFLSRFPNKYIFEDYSDSELLTIFLDMMKSNGRSSEPFFTSNPKWFRIAMKRLGKSRNTNGFGNARAVNTYFDLIKKRQAARITIARDNNQSEDINVMEFMREDILGPMACLDILDNSLAWKELLSLEGLHKVKDELRNLFDMVILNSNREEQEKPLFEVSLNRIFLGNPGTGKTTVAKLYGKILTELGLLSKGEVMVKNPSDFVGTIVGGSEKMTRNILEAANGNVLVIDEAYGLNPNSNSLTSGGSDSYKNSVIDTIVEQVQGVPGEDRAIVLVGYKEQMEEMISNCNPGFARRFQMENSLVFEDYDDVSLLRILRNMCKKKGLKINIETATYAVSQLGRAKAQQNFGNAGSVSNLLSAAQLNMQKRVKNPLSKNREELIVEDFSSKDLTTDNQNTFDGLIGCDHLIKKLEELKSTIKFCKQKGQDPNAFIEYNYIFSGPPGTGKTTIARRMGDMFSSIGLLPSNEVIEISASDLITGYVGQAGIKTREMFKKARGKVLFIDEAYQLKPNQGGSFMQEVVDEIVKCITSLEFKDKLIVIMAGYEKEMTEMLSVNPGLRSRFTERFQFEQFSITSIEQLIIQRLKEYDLKIDNDTLLQLPKISENLKFVPNFTNGRDVDSYAKRILRVHAKQRVYSDNDKIDNIDDNKFVTLEEMIIALNEFIKTKNINSLNSIPSPKLTTIDNTVKFLTESNSFIAPIYEKSNVIDIELDDSIDETLSQDTNGPLPNSNNNIDLTDQEKYKMLQDIFDNSGQNNEADIKILSKLHLDDVRIQIILNKLMSLYSLSAKQANELIKSWQALQADVQKQLEDFKENQDGKAKLRIPIWRCRVCGRGGEPFIVCNVAPYIERYDEIDA